MFQDDGYTGLNTDRPICRDFSCFRKRTGESCNSKDQSYSGRNHVQTGFLMEEFLKHGVRYIALYDNVDTFAEDNERLPHLRTLNEMYSRDISQESPCPITCRQPSGKSLQVLFHHWDDQKDPEEKDIPDWTRQHRLSGKFSSGRWTAGLTLYPENWNASRFPARHGGTETGTRTYYTKWEKKAPGKWEIRYDESSSEIPADESRLLW